MAGELTPKQQKWLKHRATPAQLATFRDTGVRDTTHQSISLHTSHRLAKATAKPAC